MEALTLQRCFYHPGREAAARCPECRRFFCRECITEHEDRVICAECLRRVSAPAIAARQRVWLVRLFAALKLCAAMLLIWILFYIAGRLLLLIPASFHEGTLWSS